MADTELDRAALSQQFVEALDVVERALHDCPEELWAASIWPVQRTDPWVWPRDGVPPIPERTDQSIQQLSAFCNVAYHCLWFLDFYVTTEVVEFQSPEYVRGGPEEQGMAADGAAPVPVKPCYPREVLLAYLGHGRDRVLERIANATEAELAAPGPRGHPHRGKSLLQLLHVNLDHVREHGGQMMAFLEGRTSTAPGPSRP
jgi:hypothetical protein